MRYRRKYERVYQKSKWIGRLIETIYYILKFLLCFMTVQYLDIDNILPAITSSTVLLYPTDTIYGLWGLVTHEVVEKISRIKQRQPEKHYSIIAPSVERVKKHFLVEDTFSERRHTYKSQFPWRGLTILLPLRENTVSADINFSLLSPSHVIWVRFLDHPFQEIVTNLWKPFITTSANLSWQPNITHPDQLLDTQKQLIDFCIDEGTLDRPASVIIDRTTQQLIRG